MAKITVYRTYRFIDKDPIIDKARTVLQDEKLISRLSVVAELSGVSRGTLDNWFNGDTKRPQFATIAAVATSIGYEVGFSKARTISDYVAEIQKAREWAKRNPKPKRKRAKKHKNGKAS